MTQQQMERTSLKNTRPEKTKGMSRVLPCGFKDKTSSDPGNLISNKSNRLEDDFGLVDAPPKNETAQHSFDPPVREKKQGKYESNPEKSMLQSELSQGENSSQNTQPKETKNLIREKTFCDCC